MGLIEVLKKIIGVSPVDIGEINKKATHVKAKTPSSVTVTDPLGEMEITDQYRKVKTLLDNGSPFVFVSGGAGTGKTTLIHYLRNVSEKNIVVVAPTGVAALNVKGATIHSFFRFPPRVLTGDDIKKVQDRRLYTKLDLLVIDEISMVRADVVDAIDRFLRLNRPAADKPFGGVQLLLVGDLFQLPPVVTTEEAVWFGRGQPYTSEFFFSAKAFQKCKMIPIELSKAFRQTNTEFTRMLDRIRIGEEIDEVISRINNECYRSSRDRDSIITLTCTNAAADRVNEAKLCELSGKPVILKGDISGKFSIENEKLPSPLNLTLKPGAQVMFTKNGRGWVNGTLGRVIKIKNSSVQVELITDHPGAIYDVQKTRWQSFQYKYDYKTNKIIPIPAGEYIQYPLMLAWAITIHKSQGKTLEKTLIDLGDGAFASGQVYVALSRCRSLSDIILKRPIRKGEVTYDQRIKRFYLAIGQMSENSE